MLDELGKLADAGRLNNFTLLAEAVMRVDDTIEHVDDKRALYRVARLLDSVFNQAYRGEKSMAFLADRVNSVAEVLDLMTVQEPEPQPNPAAPPAGVEDGDEGDAKSLSSMSWDTMWESPTSKTE